MIDDCGVSPTADAHGKPARTRWYGAPAMLALAVGSLFVTGATMAAPKKAQVKTPPAQQAPLSADTPYRGIVQVVPRVAATLTPTPMRITVSTPGGHDPGSVRLVLQDASGKVLRTVASSDELDPEGRAMFHLTLDAEHSKTLYLSAEAAPIDSDLPRRLDTVPLVFTESVDDLAMPIATLLTDKVEFRDPAGNNVLDIPLNRRQQFVADGVPQVHASRDEVAVSPDKLRVLVVSSLTEGADEPGRARQETDPGQRTVLSLYDQRGTLAVHEVDGRGNLSTINPVFGNQGQEVLYVHQGMLGSDADVAFIMLSASGKVLEKTVRGADVRHARLSSDGRVVIWEGTRRNADTDGHDPVVEAIDMQSGKRWSHVRDHRKADREQMVLRSDKRGRYTVFVNGRAVASCGICGPSR